MALNLLQMPKGGIVGHSFNGLLRNFLVELKETFDEVNELDFAIKALDVAAEVDPMGGLNGWNKSMEVMTKLGYTQPFFSELTEAKVQAFFDNMPNMHPLLGMLPLEKMWKDPGIDDEDRATIAEHLQQLELTALTVSCFDPEAIQAIEELARDMGDELKNTDPSKINVSSLGLQAISRVMNNPAIKNILNDDAIADKFKNILGPNAEALLNKPSIGGSTLNLENTSNGTNGANVPNLENLAELAKNIPPELMEMAKKMGIDPAMLSQLGQLK